MKPRHARVWILVLAVLAALLRSTPAHAQAWTRDQGHGYVNLSLNHIAGTRFFGPDFKTIPIADTYRQLTLGLYGELGIVDRWLMATISSEVYRRNQLDNQGRTDGIGDARLGLWSGVLVEPFRLSVGLVVDLPTGDSAPAPGPGSPAAAVSIAKSLPTGNGRFDVEPSLAVGTSFGAGNSAWPLLHYVQGVVGYAPRTSGFADSINYRLDLGTKLPTGFLDRFWLIVRLNGVESFASAAEAAGVTFSGLGTGLTYTALDLILDARLYRGIGASIGTGTAFRARGLIAAAPLRFALSYEF